MSRPTVAVDWDDCLVDAKTQEWLDDAQLFLRHQLAAGRRVIVHTCRANWPEGRESVKQQLAAAHLDHPDLSVVGKPEADVYVDNLAFRTTGDWTADSPAIEAVLPTPRTPRLHAVAAAPLAVVRPRPAFTTFGTR